MSLSAHPGIGEDNRPIVWPRRVSNMRYDSSSQVLRSQSILRSPYTSSVCCVIRITYRNLILQTPIPSDAKSPNLWRASRGPTYSISFIDMLLYCSISPKSLVSKLQTCQSFSPAKLVFHSSKVTSCRQWPQLAKTFHHASNF